MSTPAEAAFEVYKLLTSLGASYELRTKLLVHWSELLEAEKKSALVAEVGAEFYPTNEVPMTRFAASCVMIKRELTNVKTGHTLHIIDAVSEDEARGIAVTWAMKQNPEHQLQSIAILEIKIEPA